MVFCLNVIYHCNYWILSWIVLLIFRYFHLLVIDPMMDYCINYFLLLIYFLLIHLFNYFCLEKVKLYRSKLSKFGWTLLPSVFIFSDNWIQFPFVYFLLSDYIFVYISCVIIFHDSYIWNYFCIFTSLHKCFHNLFPFSPSVLDFFSLGFFGFRNSWYFPLIFWLCGLLLYLYLVP